MRMRMRNSSSGALACALLLGLGACGGAEPTVETPAPTQTASTSAVTSAPTAAPNAGPDDAAAAVVKLDADSPMTAPSGARYTGPKGWTITTHGGVVLLEDPNREVSVTLVERKEPDASAAVAAAWKQVKPDFARKIRLTKTPPGRGGWEAAVEVDYETTTAEERSVWAHARRKGSTWYVALFDGTNAGWGRRWSQANIAFTSFKAQGVEEESFRGKKANTLDEKRLRELEAFIDESRRTSSIPGLAVAIIQGGKVVFEKGFGVRELGKKDPVTPDTLFRIASISKPLTSLMMAVLVDEGKFSWETPATQILPTFGVGDAELSKRVTMANLVCACTGIPYDNVWASFEYAGSAEAALERLKEVKPTTGFRETFQYSNTMVAAGGFLAAHALHPKKPMGPAFDEAIRAKVLDPLGMKATTFDVSAVKRAEHASPHDRTRRFEMVASPFSGAEWTTPLRPGAAGWSNVRDLTKYLLMELGNGKTPEGKRVVSEANLLERRKPQGRSGDKTSYGLALGIETYRDVQVYGHGGSLWGYTSNVFFLPEHGVAAVVLTNVGSPNPFVFGVFRRKVFELLFDGRDEAREDLAFNLKAREAEALKETSKIDFEPDRAWLARLVGTYHHSLYGKVTIKLEGDRGIFDAGEIKGPIARKKEPDGSVKVVLTSVPHIGWPELVVKEVDGKITLLLDEGQRKVLFEPVKKGEAPRAKTTESRAR